MAGKRPTKYVEEPLPLLCPVCKKVFSEPIISVICGHTFCRECIEELIKNRMTCPLDGNICDSGQLVLNRAILGQLGDLLIYCCHGLQMVDEKMNLYEQDSEGCPEVIRVGEREKHEETCQFAWMECPIGKGLCGALRRKELEEHMEVCSKVSCPFTDFGCSFMGRRSEVAAHKESCIFKDETQLIAATMKELKALKFSNEELQKSLARANKVIEKLSSERSTMVVQLEQQALTITSLTSRMDKLETDLTSYMSSRTQQQQQQQLQNGRRSAMDRGCGGETTPRYSRKDRHTMSDTKRWSTESTTSAYLEPHRGVFHWKMPFTVKCIGTFRGHKGTIWSLVASGGYLYSGSSDGSIKMWDILDLRRGCLRTVSGHKDGVLCMTLGNGILYSVGTDHCIRSWNLETLDEIGSASNSHDGTASAMTYGKDYLFTSFLGCIKVWDTITLKEVHRIDSISQTWVRALAYNRRKDLLFSCSSNKIHIWKAYDDFCLVNEIETLFGSLYSLATTRKYLITGTQNQNIQVYDITSFQHLHTLTGHIGRVSDLRVTESPYGDYMFSASSDTTVAVWDLEKMLPILTLQRHEKAVHSLAVWQDSVFTGSEDMEIKVFKHFKL